MKNRDYAYESNRTGSTFTAFLVGGLIGGAIALLYAPKSGKETREYLMSEGQATADRVMRSIEDAQIRLEAMNQDTKDRLQRLQSIAQETIDEEKEILGRRYGQAKEAMRE